MDPLKADNFSNFDHGFIDSILSLMINDLKFLREQSDNIKPELFGDELRMKLAEAALDFYKKSACAPKNLYFDFLDVKCRTERLSEARVKLLMDKAKEVYQMQPNEAYVTERLNGYFKFAKIKSFRYMLDRAVDEGDIEKASKLIEMAQVKLVNNNGNKPVDYFGSLEQRIGRRDVTNTQEDGVHLLIPTLDRKGVFAHRGEVSLIIAPSKRGKSVFMTHIGKCALVMGHHVLHVSLENPLAMVEDRYDAMFSGLEIEHLRLLSDKLRTKIDRVRGMVKGRLHIVWHMARTYSPIDLKADVERLRSEGTKIDTVIIDYGELLKPVGKYSGESAMRAARDDIFMNLRGIATNLDFTCITAQQTPLKKRKQFRIYMEDGQESSMPAQHSSLIMTLNQTADEQAAGEMRLYVDGYWHGPSGAQIGDVLLKQDIARMQFCLSEMPINQGVEYQKNAQSPSP